MDEIPLRDYLESKIEELEKRIDLNLKLNKEALVKSDCERDLKLGQMAENIKKLELSKASLEGKASMSSVYVSYIIAGLSIIISFLLKYIR